jgi:ubiquinone biosynthesis protein UbiJ
VAAELTVKCDGSAKSGGRTRGGERRNPGAILGRAVTPEPLVAFLNHLLEPAPWARERLAPFAGRTWRVTLAPLPDLTFVVAASGTLEASDATPEPDLVVALTPAALPALARRDESVLREMTFSGDAELAAALQFLARHLQWDVEEDLSRVVGDVAAHRIAGGARDFLAWQKEAALRLGQNVAEYLTEEAGVIAAPADVTAFARAVDDLRDAVERLEKRIEHLERSRNPEPTE